MVISSVQFSRSVASNSLWLWTAARQASLSITNSRSPPKPMSIESVMPSNHLILCRPLLLLPSIFPSIRVFSNESALHIRWPKYWGFSFSISPSNEYSGLISCRINWSPCSPRDSRVFSNTTVRKHQFFSAQPSLWSNSHIHTWLLPRAWLGSSPFPPQKSFTVYSDSLICTHSTGLNPSWSWALPSPSPAPPH